MPILTARMQLCEAVVLGESKICRATCGHRPLLHGLCVTESRGALGVRCVTAKCLTNRPIVHENTRFERRAQRALRQWRETMAQDRAEGTQHGRGGVCVCHCAVPGGSLEGEECCPWGLRRGPCGRSGDDSGVVWAVAYADRGP